MRIRPDKVCAGKGVENLADDSRLFAFPCSHQIAHELLLVLVSLLVGGEQFLGRRPIHEAPQSQDARNESRMMSATP